ncbi:MAG: hypothetical protein EPO21_12685 [Chloroflexota bacterium]|nr:MAG: hypothetical protein EPO21_12685 [Chloroflexota bacterium]
MSNLYLVDKIYGQNGLKIAQSDPDAKVVLIQDGVYLDASALAAKGAKVYAVAPDVERRGLSGKLSGSVEIIDYDQLVDLIVANKVINFA